MFKKPYKLKSQIQLKSSEKKKFGNDVKSVFPSLTTEQISFFSNNKESIMKMKIETFNEELVEVYVVDKVPMFFHLVDLKVKLPTVFMCWKFPHIVTTFTTNSVVLDKIKNGADLFLPGVYLDTVAFQESSFKATDPAGVNDIANSAVFAVGQCLMSRQQVNSADATLLGGRLFKVFHTVGDHLCKSHPQPTPSFDPPLRMHERPDVESNGASETIEPSTEEQLQGINLEEEPSSTDVPEPESEENRTSDQPAADPSQTLDEAAERARMDALMMYCFLKALKTAPKTIYPILPAAFYANHMLPAVPSGDNLNVKRTKWKKLSVLLQEMAALGVVKLETVRANEYRLLSADQGHRALKEFVDPHRTPITLEATPSAHVATTVQEVFVSLGLQKGDEVTLLDVRCLGCAVTMVVFKVFVVTAPTQPLFVSSGLQKGDEVTRLDVRAALADYVRLANLALPEAPDRVRPDEMLSAAIRRPGAGALTRLELLAAVLAVMPLRHKVSARGDTIVHKANLPLVEFEVVTRSGNKKVTIISNVEGYGVDVAAFAKALQHAAAASTSVTGVVPGKKGPQVQVQGNQILVAAKLLTQNHGINEKFMRGLEKAPKARKK